MNDLNVLTRHYYSWRIAGNWPRNVKYFFRTLKYAYQRITKGYCDSDLWSLDMYYAKLISTSLKEFADITHSYPYNSTPEEWKEELLKIAECFENSIEPEEVDKYFEQYLELREKRGITLISDIFNSKIEDTEEEKELLEKSRKQRQLDFEFQSKNKDIGLKLLSKWWYDLWD